MRVFLVRGRELRLDVGEFERLGVDNLLELLALLLLDLAHAFDDARVELSKVGNFLLGHAFTRRLGSLGGSAFKCNIDHWANDLSHFTCNLRHVNLFFV